MADEYQSGNDLEWLKHSNDELARMVKKRDRQLSRLRLLCLVLFLLLGWVLVKFRQRAPLDELLRPPAPPARDSTAR
jgi:hypothetical protein